MLPADIVLVAVGLVLNTQLAQITGLDIGNGIKIDEYRQTSDPDIYAVGDCTEFPLPFCDNARTRLKSVPSVVERAPATALHINGDPMPYNLVPWFWSDQYNLKLQPVGVSAGHAITVKELRAVHDGFRERLHHGQGGRPKKASALFIDNSRVRRHIRPLLGTGG